LSKFKGKFYNGSAINKKNVCLAEFKEKKLPFVEKFMIDHFKNPKVTHINIWLSKKWSGQH